VVGRLLIKSGAKTATSAVEILALPSLACEGQPSFRSAAFNLAKAQETARKELTGAGAVAERYLPKVFTHFKNGLKALQEIEKVHGRQIASCDQALDLSKKAAELLHEMTKVHLYLMPVIAMLDVMSTTTIAWGREERGLWQALERDALWFVRGSHRNCFMAKPSHCYGEKSAIEAQRIQGPKYINHAGIPYKPM
jgi:hypothetical protein